MSMPPPKSYVAAAINAVGQVRGVPPGTLGREIRKVGIIGAGLMGSGIAVCFLGANMPVVLLDQSNEALEKGRREVGKAFASLVKRGILWDDLSRGYQGLLTTTSHYADLADCDLVIEAVFERMDVKQTVFRQLAEVAKPGAVLATNTSGLDVDAIAQASGRPADVVGLHFFSPAFMMPLLEIVRGRQTSPATLRTAIFASTVIRKTGVVVGNCPGFAANRMLEGYAREAERLVLQGVDPERLDRVITAYGFPMGPCAMGDMAGLDVRAYYLDALRAARLIPDDPAYGAMTRALLQAGRKGQKSGSGNYDYGADGRTPQPSPVVAEVRDRVAAELGIERREFSDEEIVMRCLLPVINEAARVLDEGVIDRASDADVIWIYGYGFPAAKGGPVYQALAMGLEKVRSALETQRAADPAFGDAYWTPSPALAKLFA
ncbi:3-hydroxyacyl-CoA dehydrogenase [Rubrivivax albus]|uniref:3-hydroxyacyl-CoA dehydrogenase n=1 Tax=Rubrivivax albus TaxID=2499835 RepID=A0A3S2TQN5_9BURK|nr:3-hydroxyacyl-CoA dehydrogenase [Rubrivivax albus]RVT51297.1 3-hydroxyacyl-CoA dehydrogenase [Rubrivivax albus]